MRIGWSNQSNNVFSLILSDDFSAAVNLLTNMPSDATRTDVLTAISKLNVQGAGASASLDIYYKNAEGPVGSKFSGFCMAIGAYPTSSSGSLSIPDNFGPKISAIMEYLGSDHTYNFGADGKIISDPTSEQITSRVIVPKAIDYDDTAANNSIYCYMGVVGSTAYYNVRGLVNLDNASSSSSNLSVQSAFPLFGIEPLRVTVYTEDFISVATIKQISDSAAYAVKAEVSKKFVSR